MSGRLVLFVAAFFFAVPGLAATPFYVTALDSAKGQLTRLTSTLGTAYNKFPRSINADGSVATVTYSDWTSGFFPGCLWLMYRYTSDNTWATKARHWTDSLHNAATVNDHDVGFRIMCSYGTGLALQTASQTKLDTAVMMRGARTLSARYNNMVKAIKSWNTYAKNGVTYTYPVIIDNMMNLELLCWAAQYGKDSSFLSIAESHAATTKKNHFRSNFSSFHLVAYDSTTGAVIARMTVQGYADTSSWARGQGWGLYGYTMMYRFTKDTVYLNQATHIADYIVSRLPSDLVPNWDFDVPANPTPSKDASASAIYASALVELSTYVSGGAGQAYYQKAKAILQSLASSAYTAAPNTNGNFILAHSTGNHPAGTEIDVPLIYADYYYLEALLRMKSIEDATPAVPARGSYLTEKNGSCTTALLGKGRVRFEFPLSAGSSAVVRIYDMAGRLVARQSSTKGFAVVDLSEISRGCFRVQVERSDAATLYAPLVLR